MSRNQAHVVPCRLKSRIISKSWSWWLRLVHLVTAVVVHVLAVASGAPAPRPSGAASALFPVVIARASLASWRWAYEGEVHGNLLLEELFAVRAFDRCLGFLDGVVLD